MSAGKVAMCFLGQAGTLHRDQDVGSLRPPDPQLVAVILPV